MTREERDALILQALPTVRKHCYSYARVRRLDYADIVSDGYYAVIGLVNEYDPEKGSGDWLRFVATRLRQRLVDVHRLRVGRQRQPTFERRHRIYYALSLEAFGGFNHDEGADVRQGSDAAGWWPEPVDYCDPCDELACADAFTHFLERLPARTKEMVGLRLDGFQYQEIGARYGITESRVCQIFAELRPKLERELVA